MSKVLPSFVRDLAEAAWVEADVALANAWRDVVRLNAILDAASGKAVGKTAMAEIAGEALLVRQSLERAARTRGLLAMGAVAEIVKYDAKVHQTADGSKLRSGVRVRVLAPGAARRIGADLEMITLALVERAPAKTPAAAPKPVRAKKAPAKKRSRATPAKRSSTKAKAKDKAKKSAANSRTERRA